ncbi:MAG TPA: transporter substrate-binding domain-containing protein [Acidimicrobiales bacterium]|jgi:ABC-type amino acid transport substrate-binding protein|nr:transporter substrate-binding domain-containing protein [Acidimicrobiales bacterium]|tara:strand:- start:1652 stop:2281 length:630 start_codon:yes stop_codon:yes gene_type:complete
MHNQELRVRVGYQEDFSPFAMASPAGPQGLAVAILTTGFEKLGTEADWVPLSLTEQISALCNGEVDMLACLGVTTERQSQVVFGDPIIRTGGALFTIERQPTEPARIVTPSAGPLVAATQAAYPTCSVVEVDDYPQALSHVVDGHADAAALNFHVGSQVAEREFPGKFVPPGSTFEEIYLAPAWAPTHDTVFRNAITSVLAAINPLENP